MAYATRTYTPGSSTTTFALTTSGGDPIGYIQEADITVKVNGTTYTNADSGTNTYQISGTSTVEQPNGGNVVLNAGVTGTVILERNTAIQNATVVYTAGSTLTSTDLNNADNQIRFGLQEFSDEYASLVGTGGNLTDLSSFIGGGETWVSNDAKAATTGAIDGRIDTKTTAKVKDDIIATAPVSIADDSPSAGKITVSVDAKLTELATMDQNTANSLADLTQAEVQILDGATLTTTELNYVDGVTSAVQTQLDGKQASDADLTAIAALAKTDGNIIVGDGATWVAENGATARTSLGAQAAATDLTTLSSMQSGAAAELASLTSTELDILDGATLTTTELNYVDGVTSAIQTQLDGKQASGSYQPLDSDLTTLAGMQSGTASILAGGTALTSTLTELNQLDGKTLGETTLTTNSDTNIPTSKAVNDRILTVTNALGGFVAIDNEASFPNTHPDPSGGAGTVVSIADVGGLVVNSSGVATNAATVGGTAVTINGIATNFRSTTMTAGVGMQVQTTTTLNTYTYHKAILRDADISSISTDLDDFANRYRVGDSDPGTDNDEGDLFFNRNSNTMKVYDGSNWGEVTSVGDFKFLFLCPKNGGSGNPTFDSSEKEFDLRETSNTGTAASITNAAQLMISVNGVIQKPNAGTNESGLDGFVLADANTIKFCGAPVSGDEIFVIQSGSAVTLNAPANNTVGTDQLQNGAVQTAKIGDNQVTGAKIAMGSDASGDILYYNGTDYARLAKGTDGQVLKLASGVPSWAADNATDATKMPLAGGTFTGDVTFDNQANAGRDIRWDESDDALEFDDNTKATFGSDADFSLYHTGSHLYMTNTTGNWYIQPKSNETAIEIVPDGKVGIRYNNVTELETKNGGVKLLGHSEQALNALGNTTGSTTIDFTVANIITATLTGNATFANPTTESVGQSGSIIVTQDATGSRTLAWGSQFKWTGGTAPTLTTTANAVDRIDYLVVAADTIHCVASLDVK